MADSEAKNTGCPLCGSQSVDSYFDTDSRIRMCNTCKVGFLDTSLWIDDLNTYYENNESYSQNSLDEDRVKIMHHAAGDLLMIMKKYISSPVGKTLLDIGSNYGIFLDDAKREGYQVSGIEMNKKLVELARERGLSVTHGAALDINDIAAYDVITMIHVLEHISDIHTMLTKVHSALRPEGYFFVEVQNIESYIAKKHKESWKYVSLEHLYYFTPATLTKLLEDSGFSVVSVIPRNHYLETFSIKYLLQYLFATKQNRDRFFKKGEIAVSSGKTHLVPKSFLKKIIRAIIIFLIKLCKRQDLMLIVAQKKK